MQIYLKEKIGTPELFTGRTRQLKDLLKWVDGVKKEISPSRAILSRRKTGKTALLQRFYNLVFQQGSGVIPFYYEVGEGRKWTVDFCTEFFLTFIYQYVAYKTRNPEYILIQKRDISAALEVVRKEKLDYLIPTIEDTAFLVQNERGNLLWDAVREAPYRIACLRNEFIVQIIDEFQFLNSEIYWDEAKTNQASDFASGYMRTAEYKNAPLLVSGSWIGWLMQDLTRMPGRFILNFLESMPESEVIETVFKHSQIYDIPVTEETACMIAEISEGNPFYVSSLFRSPYPDKDLANTEGLLKTLEFETLNSQGIIKNTWMEYIQAALEKVNDRHAKHIVLYLCKHREREITRKELRDKLQLEMEEPELEKKLKALVMGDIIHQGKSNFDYHGIRDNLFDKVFRGVYQKEIEAFDEKEITNEYQKLLNASQTKYRQVLGAFNQAKGAYAEYLIIRQLRFHAGHKNERLMSITENLPEDFQFVEYQSVWSYQSSPIEKRNIQIDVFARAKTDAYSIIGEVKKRDTRKFSKKEAVLFMNKMQELKRVENIQKAIGFVFSVSGFTKDTLSFLKEHGIAWSKDKQWLNI